MSEDIMFAIYVAIIVFVALMMAIALWRGRHAASQNAKVVANQSVLIEQNKQAAEVHLRQARALERIADALEAQPGQSRGPAP